MNFELYIYGKGVAGEYMQTPYDYTKDMFAKYIKQTNSNNPCFIFVHRDRDLVYYNGLVSVNDCGYNVLGVTLSFNGVAILSKQRIKSLFDDIINTLVSGNYLRDIQTNYSDAFKYIKENIIPNYTDNFMPLPATNHSVQQDEIFIQNADNDKLDFFNHSNIYIYEEFYTKEKREPKAELLQNTIEEQQPINADNIDALKAQADNGDVNTMTAVAKYYKKVGNDEQSFIYFHKAAKEGNREAMYHLAECYKYGWGTEKSILTSDLWTKKANLNQDEIKQIKNGRLQTQTNRAQKLEVNTDSRELNTLLVIILLILILTNLYAIFAYSLRLVFIGLGTYINLLFRIICIVAFCLILAKKKSGVYTFFIGWLVTILICAGVANYHSGRISSGYLFGGYITLPVIEMVIFLLIMLLRKNGESAYHMLLKHKNKPLPKLAHSNYVQQKDIQKSGKKNAFFKRIMIVVGAILFIGIIIFTGIQIHKAKEVRDMLEDIRSLGDTVSETETLAETPAETLSNNDSNIIANKDSSELERYVANYNRDAPEKLGYKTHFIRAFISEGNFVYMVSIDEDEYGDVSDLFLINQLL